MIGVRRRPGGGRWAAFGLLAVLCAIAWVAAGMLASQALDAAVHGTEDRTRSFAARTVAPVLGSTDTSIPLPESMARKLALTVASTVGEDGVARIRLFAPDGALLFSTDDGDRLGTRKVGDPRLITAAVGGATASEVGADEIAARDGSGSVGSDLLRVYAPVAAGSTTSADAVLEIDHRYAPLAEEAETPWSVVRIGAIAVGALSGVLAFGSLVQWVAGRRQAARSGFAPPGGKAGAKAAREAAALQEQAEAIESEAQAVGN